jgi:hypothetical protein
MVKALPDATRSYLRVETIGGATWYCGLSESEATYKSICVMSVHSSEDAGCHVCAQYINPARTSPYTDGFTCGSSAQSR